VLHLVAGLSVDYANAAAATKAQKQTSWFVQILDSPEIKMSGKGIGPGKVLEF